MKIKVGINGFGRIGRNVLRIVEELPKDSFEIVAINARAEAETLAHLFKYDSCYGIFKGDVEVKDEETIANNSELPSTINYSCDISNGYIQTKNLSLFNGVSE
ncbi:glyceraldehyde 3-phosphate dehydrogenase NAD-binding domain-containing protein, partial [Terrisporobacter hibernicus]|uniref:glyceraldehyde 3-phosphate dehydrogenase NAD-binding domain-containing protein n=1 Tax=Terrisporobacter hibernicus TaxID=2813371 RepID=UPI0023F07BA4